MVSVLLAHRRDRVARDARRLAAVHPDHRKMYVASRSRLRAAIARVRRDVRTESDIGESFRRFMRALGLHP